MRVLFKALLLLVMGAFAYFIYFVYRPYIYENSINDFHLADSLPSFLGVCAIYLMFDIYRTLRRKNFSKINMLLQILVASILYECLQLFVGGFDVFDIIAIILGAAVVFLIINPFKIRNYVED